MTEILLLPEHEAFIADGNVQVSGGTEKYFVPFTFTKNNDKWHQHIAEITLLYTDTDVSIYLDGMRKVTVDVLTPMQLISFMDGYICRGANVVELVTTDAQEMFLEAHGIPENIKDLWTPSSN